MLQRRKPLSPDTTLNPSSLPLSTLAGVSSLLLEHGSAMISFLRQQALPVTIHRCPVSRQQIGLNRLALESSQCQRFAVWLLPGIFSHRQQVCGSEADATTWFLHGLHPIR